MGVPVMVAGGCSPPIPAAACSQLDHTGSNSYGPLEDCVSTLNTPAQNREDVSDGDLNNLEDLAREQPRHVFMIPNSWASGIVSRSTRRIK